MDDGVAVGADRSQIRDRVDLIPLTNAGQRSQVVDMDEILSNLPVDLTKVEAADDAPCTVVGDALLSCLRIALIGVDYHLSNCALIVDDFVVHFICRNVRHGFWNRGIRCVPLLKSETGSTVCQDTVVPSRISQTA